MTVSAKIMLLFVGQGFGRNKNLCNQFKFNKIGLCCCLKKWPIRRHG